MGDAKPKGWGEGHSAAMMEVAQALGLDVVSLDDLRAIRGLLDAEPVVIAKGTVDPASLAGLDWQLASTAGSGPLVYAWAVWRDPVTALYERRRMHLPLSVVLAHAIGPAPAQDVISRVIPQIELDLLGEPFKRGARWV